MVDHHRVGGLALRAVVVERLRLVAVLQRLVGEDRGREARAVAEVGIVALLAHLLEQRVRLLGLLEPPRSPSTVACSARTP
jgi:hypothetical protein